MDNAVLDNTSGKIFSRHCNKLEVFSVFLKSDLPEMQISERLI